VLRELSALVRRCWQMKGDPVWYLVNVEGAILGEGRYLIILRGPGESHAPGGMAFPGGKVEGAGGADDVLEETLRREIREEVGIEVEEEMAYLQSSAFVTDGGEPVVDVVFLCRHRGGTPRADDPDEVSAIEWMTAAELLADPRIPPWTQRSVRRAEEVRVQKGW
jgi:8-oxo-dGTP pyrophosphatase MutT (NUDIX family)